MTKKIALITGAGSGLGAALAQGLVKEQYHVCLAGRTKNKLDETGQSLSGSYSTHTLDVRDEKQVSETIRAVKKAYGNIDLLINNAGLGVFDVTENLSPKAVHDMIDINLKGTIFCTQAVVGDMKLRNEGTIVNIVSTAGTEGKITETVYCASKFGVRGYTESLQLELQDTDIRLHGIYMGGMKTNFWDGILGEEITSAMMDPNDIADIILANIKYRKHINVSDVIIKNKAN